MPATLMHTGAPEPRSDDQIEGAAMQAARSDLAQRIDRAFEAGVRFGRAHAERFPHAAVAWLSGVAFGLCLAVLIGGWA